MQIEQNTWLELITTRWYGTNKNKHSLKGFPWLFPSTPTCAGIVSYLRPHQHQNLSFVIIMSLHIWNYDQGKWCAIKWTKNWWFTSSEMWHSYWVSGSPHFEVPWCLHIWRLSSPGRIFVGLLAWTPLKCQGSLTQQHSVTFQEAWIPSSTAVRILILGPGFVCI